MNVTDLSENDIEQIKKLSIENGNIIKKSRISSYDVKFSDVVVLSAKLIKFFIYLSIVLYVAFNIFGLVLSIVYDTFNTVNLFGIIVAIFVISFITIAIFNNVNTNKKKETNTIYIKDGNFIFNYCNDIVDTPDLFYILPYGNIKQLDVLIYGIKKEKLYAKVTFIFDLFGYDVAHTVLYANFTDIKSFIAEKFPSLMSKINVDNKKKSYYDKMNKKTEVRNFVFAAVCLAASVMITVIPLLLNYFNLALIIAGAVLFLTSVIIFISKFIYTNLEQGTLISGVFIIIGYCVPLFIVFDSEMPFLQCIAQDTEILLPTMLGNIGIALYLYIISITVGKIHFKLKYKKDTRLGKRY